MVEHLTAETFKAKVFNYEAKKEWKFEGAKPCLIDFYASWCGPCRMMAPNFHQAAIDLEPRARLVKVNTEAEQQLAARFNIRSIPTLAISKGGGEIARQSGTLDLGSLKRWIEPHLRNP